MSRLSEQDPVDTEIQVADFGPIVEAKVNLRPLTVFVGPSNTGKSYLAILIYAMSRFFSSIGTQSHALKNLSLVASRKPSKLPHAIVDSLRKIAQSFQAGSEQPFRDSVVLPSPLTEMMRPRLDEKAALIFQEINRCFGLDEPTALIRKGRSGTHIVLQQTSDESVRSQYAWTLERKRIHSKTSIISRKGRIPLDSQTSEHLRYLSEGSAVGGEVWAWLLINVLEDWVLRYGSSPLSLPSYYLPADRTGVMHAHRVVVSALIGSAPMAGLRPGGRTSMLSGVLADFLEQLIQIDGPWPLRRPSERDLSAGIEETILGGKVRVERSPAIDYPSFVYRPGGWKGDLPLMNASSMVSELAPVVLYLRHIVKPENVLIVEEPESHLHPAMQVEFTRQLAGLVDAGVRVIVTTHSEWLLEELANIVRRSALPESERGNVALRPEQVGAWLFKPKRRPKGSVVTEIRLDDSGLYPSEFDEVAAALHNDWAGISSRMENDS